MRGLARLARGIGYAHLCIAAAALLVFAWFALRVVGYEQREEPGALARKQAELARIAAAPRPEGARPNLVLVVFDDLGYGDLGAYGSRALETPQIDRLAAEGMALDHFYAAAPVCTPSRAGLLTGRWPIRTTLMRVVFPTGHPLDSLYRGLGRSVRLPADEITLAEALRAGGYATALVGKWHLGDHSPSLPNDLGFEHFLGLLYSNDLEPTDLWQDRAIIEPAPVDQSTLTQRYTQAAIDFVEANRERPFFLYLAHSSPHLPLHASREQSGRSAAGRYGDVVADLDASTGALLDALERLGLAENTLVVVTSDNGPWFQGSAGGLRGRKAEVYEGGLRVPFLARWPGRIPAGERSDAVASAVDLLPTLLAAARLPLPQDRVIDGIDLLPLLAGDAGAAAREREILYFTDVGLRALRLGRWKWHPRHGIPYPLPGLDRFVAAMFPQGPFLFDLSRDPDESYDLSAREPELLARFERRARELEAEFAANPRGWR